MTAPSTPGHRPRRLVVVLGTGTDVGKTWVTARLVHDLRAGGMHVAARKPAQSFAPGDDPQRRDAAVLGSVSGEPPESVCPPHRWYEVPMAPPMAAAALGRPAFGIADLVDELAVSWPHEPVDVGLVETAGGVRSPIAGDGDCLHLCDALGPDLVVLVADAGLGTINAVRLSVDSLGALASDLVVVVNRFDPSEELHVRNAEWLRSRDGLTVVEMPGSATQLSALVAGSPRPHGGKTRRPPNQATEFDEG